MSPIFLSQFEVPSQHLQLSFRAFFLYSFFLSFVSHKMTLSVPKEANSRELCKRQDISFSLQSHPLAYFCDTILPIHMPATQKVNSSGLGKSKGHTRHIFSVLC